MSKNDKTLRQVSKKTASELDIGLMESKEILSLFITGEVDSIVNQMSLSVCFQNVKLQESKDGKF